MDPSLPPSPGATPRSARAALEELADRLGTSSARVAAGVALAVVVAAVAVVALVGRDAPPPELTIPYADGAGSDGGGGDGAGRDAAVHTGPTTTTVAEVVAHAAGAIVRPGVYALPGGSRVGDLLAAAGGPLEEADLDRLNLAAPLLDGSRVYVPEVGEDVVPAVDGPDVPADPGGSTDGPLDLNSADAAALESLPGIGPATAGAIVAHREAHGPFRSVDDLLDVRGIGDAKLAALRDLVTV